MRLGCYQQAFLEHHVLKDLSILKINIRQFEDQIKELFCNV